MASDSIDAAVLLNVLEHIDDDNRALDEVQRILKPGGIAVIEVPAGPHLFDLYDQFLMHYRRYTLEELTAKAAAVGFEILSASHLGFLVYPAFYWTKQKNRRRAAVAGPALEQTVSTEIRQSRGSRLLAIAMKLENLLGTMVSFPWGIRCVVTCKKRVAL
jgi:SAM-dependent methyltransferase